MKPVKRSYFSIVLMAVVCSACREPEAKENVTASALATVSPAATKDAATATTSSILQSTDGGLTWQDISEGLPEREQPQSFFAGESYLYVQVKNEMYRSRNNLKRPKWEKESAPGTSGRGWPRSIFETADGTVFLCYDKGLYKSVDKGQLWRQVQKGPVMNVVESEGVLLATGGSGIMRSTDHGEHWEWVISEGGVGIAVERIDGGFAAISYSSITKSRRIRISLDKGKTWKAIDEGLPPSLSISSIKQIGRYLLCGHPDGIFRSSDMGNTWRLVQPGVENRPSILVTLNTVPSRDDRKVFKLFVSGNVLYAMAVHAGC